MKLFLGTPFTSPPTNQALYTLFTQKETYLSTLTLGKQHYLGKELQSSLSFEELLDQRAHVTSLLRRLYPEEHFSDSALYLLPHG